MHILYSRRKFVFQVVAAGVPAIFGFKTIEKIITNPGMKNTENLKLKVLVFDVNETLLDMTPLKDKINNFFGNEFAFKQWFGLLLQYSLVDNATHHYHPFNEIADATLDMLALTSKKKIATEEKKDILQVLIKLPPHTDVTDGLKQLKDAGYKMVTLTNSPPETLQKQLQNSGLANFFEEALSIDEYKMYKPATEVYVSTCNKLKVATHEALMIAAHGWDISGAISAGMQTAFIEREGQALYPLAANATYTGKKQRLRLIF